MARDGLRCSLCALLFSLSLCSPAAAGDDRDSAIATKLAVQTALQKGRDLLARNCCEAAVYVLEGQVEHINGSREYLAALRDAYRGYVQELRLAGKDAEAQVYQKRLQVLDPGSVLDFAARPKDESAAPAKNDKPGPVVRAQKEDEKPAPQPGREQEARALVARANQEWEGRRYDAAGRLFEQAHRLDAKAVADGQERWAYCKLYAVVQQLNDPAGKGTSYPELEREVRQALSLAPRLEKFGTELLGKIEERRGGKPGPPQAKQEEAASPVAVSVRHADRPLDGWYVAETANFRILHNQPRDLVERVARVAEQTRADMHRKWFGGAAEAWNPVCDLVLHATADDYSVRTGVPRNSPGHSTVNSDRETGRVVSRRIDLHCDDPNMLSAVLPHETTHVVLAGQFGKRPVPRWADEGIAVLSEPRDKVERHLRNLPQHRQDRQLLALSQLLQLDNYPEPRLVGAFYAQSVSLVEFLAKEKGPQAVTEFVRDGMYKGYEAALKRHFGIQDFAELERRWWRHAFGDGANPPAVAERTR